MQWLLRILVGADVLYLAVAYKFAQPNLMLGVIDVHHIPTFGLEPVTFVLLIAVVETLVGLLILVGVMIRPLAVVLFVAFTFFTLILREAVLAHIIIYGLLVPLITNGAGHWHGPLKTKAMAHPDSQVLKAEQYGAFRMGA
ncbi:MAG: hypothetical protein C3F08_06680 [Candidatus Methylomirabilota bacterium]|nr:MAG: hypothetical protein C3F08_06680 [candidate division NC10 bacterium]